MNDQAFTFQTLHPDTIMDALFEQGIRVDSGLTALNSYENRVYQFQDEERQRFVVKFTVHSAGPQNKFRKNISLPTIYWMMMFPLRHRLNSITKRC